MSTWEHGEAQTHTQKHMSTYFVFGGVESSVFNAELRGGQQTADSLRPVLLKQPEDGEARQLKHKRQKELFVAVGMTS